MTTTTTPYPPSAPHTTTRIPPSTALQNLQSYLELSQRNPHLHPDALLDPRGIKFSTTGGPSGGLVIHNLRRVERGLDGEVLAPEKDELADLFPVGEDGGFDAGVGAGTTGTRKGGLKRGASVFENVETEDPVEYARRQEVLTGEVGERDAAGGEEMEGVVMGGEVEGSGMSKREKEARKEEKKRRLKEEKRERAEGRMGKK